MVTDDLTFETKVTIHVVMVVVGAVVVCCYFCCSEEEEILIFEYGKEKGSPRFENTTTVTHFKWPQRLVSYY